jgi:hypothetical protein
MQIERPFCHTEFVNYNMINLVWEEQTRQPLEFPSFLFDRESGRAKQIANKAAD